MIDLLIDLTVDISRPTIRHMALGLDELHYINCVFFTTPQLCLGGVMAYLCYHTPNPYTAMGDYSHPK